MDRQRFFAALRKRASGVFGTRLSDAQVKGTEAILDACDRYGMTNIHHVAHPLAHVYHETGGYMLGIKETVYASHKNKRPSDATVVRRLENAWRKGQLSWVKTPYWRPDADGISWFGRGPIQTTHKRNYLKMGARLGVDLTSDPNRILDKDIGADSAVVGMAEGLYTGKKLSDYRFPQALDAGWRDHPRRIVNGKDGTDAKISGYHHAFYAALQEAGWQEAKGAEPKPAPQPQPKPSEPDAPFQTYTVQKGDTVGRIAGRHGVPWRSVAELNGLTHPYTIYPEQVLRLPQGAREPSPAPSPAPEPSGGGFWAALATLLRRFIP